MENFINQKAEDFASMESFQNWYLKNDNEAIAFWDDWIATNPQMQNEIDQAISILKNLEFQALRPKEDEAQHSWNTLKDRLDPESDAKIIKIDGIEGNGFFKRQYFLGIAAIITLLLVSVFVFYSFFENDSEFYVTKFGETISVTLPDNSVVTLNSNSTLKYNKEWESDEERMVWLNGEAYFSVVHTETKQKFSVITSNGVKVEVLGTEFNVNKRNGRTRVVLKSGKVKLSINKPDIQEEMVMKPGELVEVRDTSRAVVKRLVNPEVYTSWRCKKLVFDNTSLNEIVDLLEESYGLTVEVSNAELLRKQISGSVPGNNTTLLMDGLSEAFDLDIVWTKSHVKIKSKLLFSK